VLAGEALIWPAHPDGVDGGVRSEHGASPAALFLAAAALGSDGFERSGGRLH
jgi:hypothetical protein